MKSFSALFPVGLLALLLLALRLPAMAQAPVWQSARAVAVASAVSAVGNFGPSSAVTATAVDAVGNVYLAGTFENSAALGGTSLTSLGGQDVFVAKYSPVSNQFVWVQRAGGTGNDYAAALAVSGADVYVAGSFESATASFGPATLTNATTGQADVFVAKLIDAGSTSGFAWAQRAGGTGGDYTDALAVSGTNVYVAGSFAGPTASFGTASLTNTNVGTADVFVTKLVDAGPTGSFAWTQRAGGTGDDYVRTLAVSGASVYIAGDFRGLTASFGATTLTSAGSYEAFVAKLADAGTTSSFVWAQRAGGTAEDIITTLAVSGTSVYIAGMFGSSTAVFGPITLNAGTYDAFVAKLVDAGSTSSFVWAQQAGGMGADIAYTLAVSGTSVYVAGSFNGATASFGASTLANVTTAFSYDVFIAKLVDAGSTSSFAWAQRAGGVGDDYGVALAVSGTSVYLAGGFGNPTAGFGTTTLTNPNPNANFSFLASLTDPTLTATTTGHALAPVQLFPNPAHHAATLHLPAGTAPAPLVLSDALGRAVRRYPAPAGPVATLDLRGLPAGLYLLRGAGPAQRLVVE